MSDENETPAPTRRRRRPGVVRKLLLDAAREEFRTNGYANTSAREIALHAEVSETYIFRLFGNKANLFEYSVFEPFEEFITDFIVKWDSKKPTTEEAMQTYLMGLYKLLRQHRESVLALLNARLYDGVADGLSGRDSPISMVFDQASDFLVGKEDVLGYRGTDASIDFRAVFAMIFGLATFDEWLFPQAKHPDDDKLARRLSNLVLYGLMNNQSTLMGSGAAWNASGDDEESD